MRGRISGAMTAIVSATVGVIVSLSVPMGGQAPPAARAARMFDGHPNLNGIWQAMNTANWDLQDHPAQAGPVVNRIGALGAIPPGQGVVEGNEIPYKPAALAQKKKNFDKRMIDDPEAKCYQPGVPRATYLPHPFQFIQGDKKIMIVYGYADANRTIHMDKPKPEPAPIDSWMGRSHGRWDGDTLVVDVAGMNGQAWFDRAGNFGSENLHIVERYTPVNADILNYEATIEDSTVFTRPWKIIMPLYRHQEKNAQVLEFKCVEFSEELLYGHLRKQSSK